MRQSMKPLHGQRNLLLICSDDLNTQKNESQISLKFRLPLISCAAKNISFKYGVNKLNGVYCWAAAAAAKKPLCAVSAAATALETFDCKKLSILYCFVVFVGVDLFSLSSLCKWVVDGIVSAQCCLNLRFLSTSFAFGAAFPLFMVGLSVLSTLLLILHSMPLNLCWLTLLSNNLYAFIFPFVRSFAVRKILFEPVLSINANADF